MRGKKRVLNPKELELYAAAESGAAVQLAKRILGTVSADEMNPGEREEFERMRRMVESADFVEHPPRPAPGSAASVWLNFLDAYMKTVLYNHGELKAEIESTFKRAKKITG